jgi:hypothetical protein
MFNCFLSLFVSVQVSDAYVNVFSFIVLKWRISYKNKKRRGNENFCMAAMLLFLKSWWEDLGNAAEFSTHIALVPHIKFLPSHMLLCLILPCVRNRNRRWPLAV